jgi:nicotinamidase-related amidase
MTRLLELEDHSDVLAQQNARLEIDPARTAVVTIDLHRGHLDPVENPSSDAQRRGVLHNVEGSVQAELPPEIGPGPGDHWITTKKTYSSFIGTDLDNLLRRILGVDTVLLMGVNTNTCVLNAAFDACNHGYRAIVIEEGVASRYGEDLHAFALNAIARTCGWVLTASELKEKVRPAVGAPA